MEERVGRMIGSAQMLLVKGFESSTRVCGKASTQEKLQADIEDMRSLECVLVDDFVGYVLDIQASDVLGGFKILKRFGLFGFRFWSTSYDVCRSRWPTVSGVPNRGAPSSSVSVHTNASRSSSKRLMTG